MKYKFVIKKIEFATIELECEPDETLADVEEKIILLSEDELGFGAPKYEFDAIFKQIGKIDKLIWKDSWSFSQIEP
jgi:hypothetical protein